MKILLYLSAAALAYLLSGWNPAITFSKNIYKKDIRECGSGNPGFTNFRRTFGDRWAWAVLALDLSKAALTTVLFGVLFAACGIGYSTGAAFTGIFALLGHAFPIWYGFRGGKGFLVTLSVMWVLDWRVGVCATAVMLVLLLTTKYMSLSTVTALLVCPIAFGALGAESAVIFAAAVMSIFVAVRHKENFKRLIAGNESKFELSFH